MGAPNPELTEREAYLRYRKNQDDTEALDKLRGRCEAWDQLLIEVCRGTPKWRRSACAFFNAWFEASDAVTVPRAVVEEIIDWSAQFTHVSQSKVKINGQ